MAPVLKYSHPFIDGVHKNPENRKKELNKIKSWLNTQPHLPIISDEFIYLFLHASYYNIDKTKHMMEMYFTIRASNPTIFSDRDVYNERMQLTLSLPHLIRLPKSTVEGYRILMYSIKDNDPTKFNFNDAVKGFCMYNDCVLSEDGFQEGYVVIFDMKGVCFGHLARVSLPAVRCFMAYIQEAHPCRLKQIHVVNTSNWIHHVMRIVLPLVKTEMLSIVRFHQGPVPENFPVELLPADYGGEAETVEELDQQTKNLVSKYGEWLLETSYFKSDESKRIKKASWWGLFSGSNNSSSNSTQLDEKTILKNLQID